jgi:hypothetical protein
MSSLDTAVKNHNTTHFTVKPSHNGKAGERNIYNVASRFRLLTGTLNLDPRKCNIFRLKRGFLRVQAPFNTTVLLFSRSERKTLKQSEENCY